MQAVVRTVPLRGWSSRADPALLEVSDAEEGSLRSLQHMWETHNVEPCGSAHHFQWKV